MPIGNLRDTTAKTRYTGGGMSQPTGGGVPPAPVVAPAAPTQPYGGGGVSPGIAPAAPSPAPSGSYSPSPQVTATKPPGYDPGVYTPRTTATTGATATTGPRTILSTPISPTGATTTSRWEAGGAAPTLAPYPKFAAPEWSEEEIKKLTQKRGAAGVRRLRQAVQRVIGQPYENPAVRSMTLRQALAGYGTGLESVMGGASREAVGEYGAKYGREYQTAQTQWKSDISQMQTSFEAAWQEWLKGGKTVSEKRFTYDKPKGAGGYEVRTPVVKRFGYEGD